MAAITLSRAIVAAPTVQTQAARKEQALNKAFFGKGVAFTAAAPLRPFAGSFAVRAAETKQQVVTPLNGDPFVGMLETPVTSAPAVAWFLSNLPAYRTGVNPLLRGVEVGLAHGFFLVGPFVKTGPLRNTDVALQAGSLSAAGLVTILALCLTIYGISSFQEEGDKAPSALTLSGRKLEADKLQTADGWAGFSGGWFFGGLAGVAWAYFCLSNIPYPV